MNARCVSIACSTLISIALVCGGCASTGAKKAATESATVQGITDDYRQARLQTQAVEEALAGLVVAPNPDLGQAFDFFTTNATMMEDIGRRLITHADGMFYRGTYYFVETGKSLEACAIPRVGRMDEQRSIDLGKDFDAVSETGGEVKRAYRAFQFDIKTVRDALGYNLTPAGLESVDLVLHKAQVDSDSLQAALDNALRALDRAKSTLAQQQVVPSSPAPVVPPQR